MVTRATVVGLVAASLVACGGDPPDWVTPVPSSSILYQGEESIFTEVVERVIREPAGFSQVWERIQAGVAAPSPEPTVNFDRRMVVVLGAGRRMAGDRIRVDSVAVRNEEFRVYYAVVEDCVEGRPTIYPLQILEVLTSEYQPRYFGPTEKRPGCTQEPISTVGAEVP